MSTTELHVLIIGGGLGGLCLANGLKQAGVSVAVYERDRSPTARLQGYRIHISPTGARALQSCLPPKLFDAFVATTGEAGNGFSFLTEQLETLLYVDARPVAGRGAADRHHSVSRLTLRQVLLAGLPDTVTFDKEFVRYEETGDGRIVAHFADGTSASGDVLVAADGVSSRVRRQFLPHAEPVDTGALGIAGKVALTDEARALLPPRLFDGPGMITAPWSLNMFLAVQEVQRKPAAVPALAGVGPSLAPATGLLSDNDRDYVMWAVGARRDKFPFLDNPAGLDGAALQRTAQRLIQGWHPNLQHLIWLSDPDTITPLPIRSSVPISPWPTRRVTLLGDAIHSMTPYRGIGANVALRDAALLADRLAAAHRSEVSLLSAIQAYEREMQRYGFAAVRASRRALDQAVSESATALAVTRGALRLLGALPAPLQRLLLRGFGDA